jgi:Holliday junction DNA helicase RuvA
MIAKLHGIVDSLGEDYAVIDVNGVGYLVYASGKTLSTLVKGMEISLWIETVVREDSISLYGFAHLLEKEWFLTLTKVQGVGSKVCLAILSVLSPTDIAQAVAVQDKASFTRANGVGPKLAARIVTELKDKMVTLPIGTDKSDFAKIMNDDVIGNKPFAANEDNSKTEDAVSALVNLGYQRIEAYKTVSIVAGNNPDANVSALIRLSLKEFANKEV